jgi:hypothetical protein
VSELSDDVRNRLRSALRSARRLARLTVTISADDLSAVLGESGDMTLRETRDPCCWSCLARLNRDEGRKPLAPRDDVYLVSEDLCACNDDRIMA